MKNSPAVDPPRVSVLLPVYNSERYLRETVASVLQQTFTDFELLIVDDGSTDRSPQILAELAATDSRISVTRRPNDGYVSALNELLAKARGEYMARIDSDDVAFPKRFARQVEFLDAHPNVLVVGSYVQVIDEDGDVLCDQSVLIDHEAITHSLLRGTGGIYHPATMFRRQPVMDLGGYRTQALGVEDQDLWLRLAERGKLANLPEALLKYRIHPGNFSFVYHEQVRERFRSVLREAYARRGLPEPEDLLSEAPRVTSNWDRRREWAWGAVHSRHFRTARKHARALLAENFTSRAAWTLFAYAHLGRYAELLRTMLGRRSS
ncbi:MAG TPA: glycosyltransferase family 2 protein [Planctomycetaceae bacterium]|nr:glycosyltransferase family 2 protein [Planctomycetaceae bacterium]